MTLIVDDLVSNQTVRSKIPTCVDPKRRATTESRRSKLGRRALPPEYSATPVCNQGLIEYHELKHSHKMFFDHVGSRYITLDNVFTVANLIMAPRSKALNR